MLAELAKEPGSRMVVIGVGNELLMDEGVGVHVARALARETFSVPMEVIEGGTVIDCLPGGEQIRKLVVIDAVLGGGEPGAIYRFNPYDVELEASWAGSVHQLGLFDSLRLSEIAGIKPAETIIIGVEPKEVKWGTELSAELESRIPDVVQVVLEEVSVSPKHIG
ncbi:MAG: hydrogenase maturation protease [Chloroflexota bacterium]